MNIGTKKDPKEGLGDFARFTQKSQATPKANEQPTKPIDDLHKNKQISGKGYFQMEANLAKPKEPLHSVQTEKEKNAPFDLQKDATLEGDQVNKAVVEKLDAEKAALQRQAGTQKDATMAEKVKEAEKANQPQKVKQVEHQQMELEKRKEESQKANQPKQKDDLSQRIELEKLKSKDDESSKLREQEKRKKEKEKKEKDVKKEREKEDKSKNLEKEKREKGPEIKSGEKKAETKTPKPRLLQKLKEKCSVYFKRGKEVAKTLSGSVCELSRQVVAQPLIWKLWVSMYIFFNLILPLCFSDTMAAKGTLLAFCVSCISGILVYTFGGFSRFLGLTYLTWVPLCYFLFSTIDPKSLLNNIRPFSIWLRGLYVTNSISLALGLDSASRALKEALSLRKQELAKQRAETSR